MIISETTCKNDLRPTWSNGLCKSCYSTKWNNEHPERRKKIMKQFKKRHPKYQTAYSHNFWFGGKRDLVMVRDNYKCTRCGMTDQQHLNTWHCHLTVDHIDGLGRGSSIKNNHINNLQTLCRRCHAYKDGLKQSGSKFIGVTIKKYNNGRKWKATIGFGGKKIYLGQFSNESLAASAYNRKFNEFYPQLEPVNII